MHNSQYKFIIYETNKEKTTPQGLWNSPID